MKTGTGAMACGAAPPPGSGIALVAPGRPAVARRDLDAEFRRKGQREAAFVVTADPNNIAELRDVLTAWLDGMDWPEALWGEFDMLVRFSGEQTIRRSVRP
jgi:hypothetical protein